MLLNHKTTLHNIQYADENWNVSKKEKKVFHFFHVFCLICQSNQPTTKKIIFQWLYTNNNSNNIKKIHIHNVKKESTDVHLYIYIVYLNSYIWIRGDLYEISVKCGIRPTTTTRTTKWKVINNNWNYILLLVVCYSFYKRKFIWIYTITTITASSIHPPHHHQQHQRHHQRISTATTIIILLAADEM